MARYQVGYTPFRISAPRLAGETPDQRPTIVAPRPLLPVRLDFNDRVAALYTIVDSGAHQCLFPGFVVRALGLNIETARSSKFAGAGSVNQTSLFFENIGMTIGPIPRNAATISFSAAMDHAGFGLLGQDGFFARFRVHFDLPEGFFYIDDGPPLTAGTQQL